jgi:hypothetical protein
MNKFIPSRLTSIQPLKIYFNKNTKLYGLSDINNQLTNMKKESYTWEVKILFSASLKISTYYET